MITNFYLVINKKGSVKAVKTKPALAWDEIGVKFELKLPDALFTKPQIQAQVTIPDSAAAPQLIDAAVINNVKEAIQTSTGLEVQLSVVSDQQ